MQSLVIDGLNYSLERTGSDSRVTAVFHQWAACMAKEGYVISSVERRSQLTDEATGKGKASEIKLATSDVTCAQAVNSPGVQYAVDLAYQERWLKEHASQLQALQEQYLAGLERAQKVLVA